MAAYKTSTRMVTTPITNDIPTLDGYVIYSTSTKSGKIGEKTWSAIFKDAAISNTAANRKAFIYSAALHCGTDVF